MMTFIFIITHLPETIPLLFFFLLSCLMITTVNIKSATLAPAVWCSRVESNFPKTKAKHSFGGEEKCWFGAFPSPPSNVHTCNFFLSKSEIKLSCLLAFFYGFDSSEGSRFPGHVPHIRNFSGLFFCLVQVCFCASERKFVEALNQPILRGRVIWCGSVIFGFAAVVSDWMKLKSGLFLRFEWIWNTICGLLTRLSSLHWSKSGWVLSGWADDPQI